MGSWEKRMWCGGSVAVVARWWWQGGLDGSWLNRWSHIHEWGMKIGRDTLGGRNPSPRPDHIAQGFSTGEIKPHNFWL